MNYQYRQDNDLPKVPQKTIFGHQAFRVHLGGDNYFINPPKVYLIGSLRNPNIPHIANTLRQNGYDVFDDWFAIGPEADDHWKTYEQGRGRNFKQALEGEVCKNSFSFDRRHIDEADIGVLVMPAGKSAHTELGYMSHPQAKKKTFVLLEEDSDRWDIMYRFFTGVAYSVEELILMMKDRH